MHLFTISREKELNQNKNNPPRNMFFSKPADVLAVMPKLS